MPEPVPPASARHAGRWLRVSVLAALAPVAVAAIRALHQGWIPVSENALYAIRARDVFTGHVPLIGTLAGAAGSNLSNQPGALLFDVLAVPVTVLGGGPGVIVGVALINVASLVGIAYLAHRRGGPLLACAAMAVASGLCWTMGSTVLFEPWNPHSVLLPFLCFLLLAWSVAYGDAKALPWLVGVGSLVLQTHLSYVLLVPALAAWGGFGLVLALRRAHALDRRRGRELDRRARRAAAVAAVVLVVCWAQPLVEQFTSDGAGNLSRLAHNAGGAGPTTGYNLSTRLVASVVALPPLWFRPSFRRAFVLFEGWQPPSTERATASLAVVVALLAGCAWDAHRRRDDTVLTAVGTAAIALAVGLLTAARAPLGTDAFLRISPHVLRWLWPVGAFVAFAVAASLVRRHASGPRRVGGLAALFTLVTIAFSASNLPASTQSLGPSQQNATIPAVRALDRQLGRLAREDPLLVDDLYRIGVGDAWSASVLAELQRRGIGFVVKDAGLVRQYGDGRRYDGTNARATLLISIGDAVDRPPPGARRVARHDGISRDDRSELDALRTQIARHLRQAGFRLNARGREALARRELPTVHRVVEPRADPEPLLTTRVLRYMVQHDLLVLDPAWTGRYRRYADLQQRWDRDTVALFVRPLAR